MSHRRQLEPEAEWFQAKGSVRVNSQDGDDDMGDRLYEEKLRWFKENEKPEVVLFVGDDSTLTKIALAWTNTTTKRSQEIGPLQSDNESEVWNWLWKNTTYSRQELLTRSGVFEHGFDDRLAILIGNRILYPDGTLNSFVQRFLREKVLRLFDTRSAKSRKTES